MKKKISRRNFLKGAVASGVLFAAGCADDTSGAASGSTNGDATNSGSGEVETIVIGIQTQSVVSDYKDNALTKAIEEELGVNLEFYELPSAVAEFATKFSLLATNRTEMPDLIFQAGAFNKSEVEYYGNQGIFAPIDEYLNNEELMPNYNAIDAEHKESITAGITASDGRIYGAPKYYPQLTTMTPCKLFVNKEWLDKLNLEAPKTTDELLTVLRAFRDNDPNGNSKEDEIPLYGQFAASNYGLNIVWTIMNSFVFFNEGTVNNGLSLSEDGSTVIAPYVSNEWRQGLEYLKLLYDEKLLSPSVFTDDETQVKATLNSETPVVGVVSVGSTSNWANAEENPNYLAMDIMPPLEGPNGIAYTPYRPYDSSPLNFLTTSCKNPELAMKVVDYFFDRDNSLSARFGVKDVHWSNDSAVTALYSSTMFDDAGEMLPPDVAYDLDPSIKTWSDPNNFLWRNINPGYIPADVLVSSKLKEDFDPTTLTARITAMVRDVYNVAHPKYVMPALTYSVEETETITVPTAEIDTLLDTSTAEFITGVRTLDDAGWQAYVEEMDKLGLQTCIEVAQTAYDRIK